ncbi:GNAT family N-acetyltransferase [Geodermatophilus sp. DSM 44513]|uniref:GNAT family N-acetyltransferase n=1 Tax=Geodermatophilus sp. DSM 44513 TaxID=1528104 RepID=UPI001AA12ED9|nr:GNAT family N-acetyltransferase [Geodermatophilus sp. DSM 44513]WNV74898.1 GNAT family N-acetyltransferase [Geodermatophilus sp. DSM 44513]
MLRAVHLADGYPGRWPADPAAWLDPPDTAEAWVAERAGAVTGHVVVTRAPDGLAAVTRLFVAPDARGHGLGAVLLDVVRGWAGAARTGLVLDVVDGAAAAVGLYERQGWSLVGTRPADWTTPAGTRPLLRTYRAPAARS